MERAHDRAFFFALPAARRHRATRYEVIHNSPRRQSGLDLSETCSVKAQSKSHRMLCEQLNWQIRQREGFIRNRCSFFCFVGPVESFPWPPQVSKPLIGVNISAGRPDSSEGSDEISHSDISVLARSHFPPTSSMDGLRDSPRKRGATSHGR